MAQNDLERIMNERAQLQAWLDKNYNGSWWKAAKANKIPPTNMAVYVGTKKMSTGTACDLQNLKFTAKARLYRITGLDFLDPMKNLPDGLYDWQVKLYAIMAKEETSPKQMAQKLEVNPSTFHSYFDEPVELEHIKNGKVRNAIYAMLEKYGSRQEPAPQVTAAQPAPAAPSPATVTAPAAEKPGLDCKIDQQLAMIAKILPCAFPNGSAQGIVDGTKQLVQFLNQNLERYGASTAAQEILRRDKATLELFGRCHELLSAVYQNNPFTAHRLSTTYNPREERK